MAAITPTLQYHNSYNFFIEIEPLSKSNSMSTKKAPQDSGLGADLQVRDTGANTGGNPFLPFD